MSGILSVHIEIFKTNVSKAMKILGLRIRDSNCTDICESCKDLQESISKTNDDLDCKVSDICGPMPVTSLGRCRYFATFIDEHSKYSAVSFLKTKDEVESKEYMSNKVQNQLKVKGINYQCTVVYSTQQSGIAERKKELQLKHIGQCFLNQRCQRDILKD